MVAPVNSRDVALQSSTRVIKSNLSLDTPEGVIFSVKNNVYNPSQLTIVADATPYTDPTYTWYYKNSSGSWNTIYGQNTYVLNIVANDFTTYLANSNDTDAVTFKVEVSQAGYVSIEAQQAVSKIDVTTDAILSIATNNNIQVICYSDKVVKDLSSGFGQLYLYRGSEILTTDVVYSVVPYTYTNGTTQIIESLGGGGYAIKDTSGNHLATIDFDSEGYYTLDYLNTIDLSPSVNTIKVKIAATYLGQTPYVTKYQTLVITRSLTTESSTNALLDPSPIDPLSVRFSLSPDGANIRISWNAPNSLATIYGYNIATYNGSNDIDRFTTDTSIDIPILEASSATQTVYSFYLWSTSISGRDSNAIEVQYTIPAGSDQFGVQNLAYQESGDTLILNWDDWSNPAYSGTIQYPVVMYKVEQSGASTRVLNRVRSSDIELGVLRLFNGSDYYTSSTQNGIATKSTTITVTPINSAGVLGRPSQIVYTVVVPSAVTINSTYTRVIDNNILIKWDPPAETGNLEVEGYEVYKTDLPIATDPTAEPTISNYESYTYISLGTKYGRFTSIIEQEAGWFIYKIVPKNTAGIEGAPAYTVRYVLQPPDYIFFGQFKSQFKVANFSPAPFRSNGLTANTARIYKWYDDTTPANNYIVGPFVDSTITGHVPNTSATFATIAASYPTLLTPTGAGSLNTNKGIYEEEFIFDNPILVNEYISAGNVRVTFDTTLYNGYVRNNYTVKLSAYSDATLVKTVTDRSGMFVPAAFNKIVVRIEFNHVAAQNAYCIISNLNISVDAKLQEDTGTAYALSSDAAGTLVRTNKEFIDLHSCTAEYIQTATINKYTAITRWDDTVSPNEFYVYLFNDLGIRVNGDVSWVVKGY